MRTNPPELVRLDRLRPNPDNPKESIGAAYLAGLRASIERYGFSGTLNVGENLDGTLTVLDGNTRLEEMKRAGLTETWVCRVPTCKEGAGDWQSERVQFSLAYDRHRKKFNEDVVKRQLQELAANGEDLKRLAILSGKANLEKLLAESKTGTMAATTTPDAPPMQSLVLYGPTSEIAPIRALLKQTKGKITALEKARTALSQAADWLDWSDERVLTVLLSTIGKLAHE